VALEPTSAELPALARNRGRKKANAASDAFINGFAGIVVVVVARANLSLSLSLSLSGIRQYSGWIDCGR
jgi:hypothetical protein